MPLPLALGVVPASLEPCAPAIPIAPAETMWIVGQSRTGDRGGPRNKPCAIARRDLKIESFSSRIPLYLDNLISDMTPR
jgi:hypothetical protein